jgi:hypothetical protein
MKITEDILYFAWQYGMFDRENLFTVTGEKVEVISLGVRNTNSGPDFFGSRIKIGNLTWAGNVEMHINASDWFKHKHHLDNAYKNVILHVVANYDIKPGTADYNLNTVVLPVNKKLSDKYEEFLNSNGFIPCAAYVNDIHPFIKTHMITRTATERLTEKSGKILELNKKYRGDWNQTFYTVTARYFGAPQNADDKYKEYAWYLNVAKTILAINAPFSERNITIGLNHAKKVWTYFSDLYAVALLFLAVSGLFVLKGKNGLAGRGKWLTAIGVIIPIVFLLIYKYW